MQSKLIKTIAVRVPAFAKLTGHLFSPKDYYETERLFRGYRRSEVNEETGTLEANSIRFPDFSCNWSRFSTPPEVLHRENSRPGDGCYSFSVLQARYKSMGTGCHDPLPKNYSHTEVRQLKPDEDVFTEPPKGRKLDKAKDGWLKSARLEYRQNIVFNMTIEIEARP